MGHRFFKCLALSATFGTVGQVSASKLVEVTTIDDSHIMLRYRDAWVHHVENVKGIGAFQGHESRTDDVIETYGVPLAIDVATRPASFLLKSTSDKNYQTEASPTQVFRKTKVSGTAWKWPEPDLTYEHTLFLKLDKPLVQGASYTLSINPGTNSDKASAIFTFDAFSSNTEAIHVNLVGYHSSSAGIKSADVYQWMGDGGARDYTSYIGRKAYLVNTKTKQRTEVGPLKFWKKSGPDYGNWNLTRSDVWTVDFSSFQTPGKYRLAVQGIGASPEFEIQNDIYFEPFKTSLRGFYFMRIGEPATMSPVPRQPQFIPGKDPKDFKVYLTTYSPWHPDWKTKQGDQWDVKDWSKYLEPGSPTNPNAYGGHSDALDWDRHCGHVSIIWDLLLPYLLSNGKGGEDNLQIRESGNGIPDVIDEAQNEVDFWLRLRDTKGGYATGLNNPSDDHKTMYQGAARPYMAWANAANAAMLAEAFRVAKKPDLTKKYVAAALEAWTIANEQDLDEKYSIGNGATRGRDHKLLAAACLFSITGEKKYEDIVAAESVIKNEISQTEVTDQYNQLYGTAVYLLTAANKVRPIGYPKLAADMRASVIAEALTKNVENSEKWPSRRSADTNYGWFQAIQEVQRICVAHVFATDKDTKNRLLKALILEADWGLGRNPLNMTQMTGIGSRAPDQIYTSGRNDGVPGIHPGHTPYMNSEPWGEDFMANPRYYSSRGYPTWEQWPQGEALWRAPYCYSNNEFTPQQSMRGKHVLLAYLYTIGSPRQPAKK